jgi:iron complex outermembrane receptor protein
MSRWHTCLPVALSLLALPALGNTLSKEPSFSLPIIVITPEWHEFDIQRVPSTVNVLFGEQLDTADIQNAQDLQNRIPGLVFKSSSGVGDTYLRGIGGAVSAAGGSGVSTFVDGVYLTRTSQSLQELYDIDRVEVIKGPHGVHLARNVVGGAISITTLDPEPYRSAYADVLYGTDNRRQLRGAYNFPVPDTGLSFRLTGMLNQRDGYSRNVFLGEDLDDQDDYAWRAKLRYQPSGRLDAVFSATQSRQDDARDLGKQPDPYVGLNGGVLLGGTVPDNPRKVTPNTEQKQNIENELYSAKLT